MQPGRSSRSRVSTAVVAAMRNAAVRRAALRAAAARGRALVLVYHRVRPDGQAPHEVVSALPSAVVHAQVQALGELGDVVPLTALVSDAAHGSRVRFAVSFDDDEPGHVSEALPLLRSLGVSATFFLSGRALHGIGPYWWVTLEGLIAERGLEEVRRSLGVEGASPAELAAKCEGTPVARRLDEGAVGRSSGFGAAEIRQLVAGGMSIGFHTLEHPVLPALAPEELDRALTWGRNELAEAAGTPITLLAYPHGRANRTAARAARAAGYEAAFAAGGRPIGKRADRFLLGRWEPPAAPLDEFVASVAARLNRPVSARSG